MKGAYKQFTVINLLVRPFGKTKLIYCATSQRLVHLSRKIIILLKDISPEIMKEVFHSY